jgi:hypothetical protein
MKKHKAKPYILGNQGYPTKFKNKVVKHYLTSHQPYNAQKTAEYFRLSHMTIRKWALDYQINHPIKFKILKKIGSMLHA